MNRRGFLKGLLGVAAATLLSESLDEQVIPGNRVYSFPSKIVIPDLECWTYYRSYLVGKDAIYTAVYADYLSCSDLALQVAINPTVTQVAQQLGYRLVQTTFRLAGTT